MRRAVPIVLGAMVVTLCAGGSMARAASPARLGPQAIMQVFVRGATEISVTDPRGRVYPCEDSSCTPIPRCEGIWNFLTRRHGLPEDAMVLIMRISNPLEGDYRVRATGVDSFINVDVSCGGPGGPIAGTDGVRGHRYEWAASYRRASGDSACSVMLELLPAPPTRPAR